MLEDERLEKISRGISITLIGTIVFNFLALLFHPIIVRMLGSQEYGQLAVALAFFSIFSQISHLGLKQSIRKHLTQYSDYIDEIASYSFGVLLKAAIIPVVVFVSLAIGVNLGIPNFSNLEIDLLVLILPALFIMNFYTGIRAIFYGCYMEFHGESLRIIKQILYYSIAIFLVILGFESEGVILGLTISLIVAVLLGFSWMKGEVELSLSNFKEGRRSKKNEVLGFGKLMLVSVIFTQLHLQADIFFVSFFENDYLTGVYKGVIVIVNFLWLIPSTIQKITIYNFSDMNSQNSSSDINPLNKKIVRYTAIILFLVGLGVFTLSEPFLEFYYGSDFVRGSTVLQILVIGGVFAGIAKIMASYFEANGSLRLSVEAVVLASIINLVLNFLLAPKYGIEGVAVATAISYSSLFLIYIIFYRYKENYRPLNEIKWANLGLATSITVSLMVLVMEIVNINLIKLIVASLVGTMAYIFLIVKLDILSSSEIERYLIRIVPDRYRKLTLFNLIIRILRKI